MIKIIYLIIFFIGILVAKEVDVDIQADSFLANKSKNLIVFKGNVSMVKAEDTLVCQELVVHTKINPDTNKTVMRQYVATGDVSFTIAQPNTLFIGNGDKVDYNIEKQLYIITGNAYLEDRNGSKILRGDRIYVNQKTGTTKIDGKKNQPVKFQFKMETK